MSKITIVGAGFSGLTLAYFLNKKGAEVTLYEAQASAGGVLRTDITPFGSIEKAARGVMNSVAFSEICQTLQIELKPAKKEAKKRYIYRNKKLLKWPLGLWSTLLLIFKVLFFKNTITLDFKNHATVKDWALHNFNSEIEHYLVTPGLQGIFARGGAELSAPLMFKNFIENTVPSPEKNGLVYPEGGMENWANKLKEYLESKGVGIKLESSVQDRQSLSGKVVLCTSLKDATGLLGTPGVLGGYPVKMQSTVVVNCIFKTQSKKLDGFGCLFPRGEGVEALGVVSNTNTFDGLSDNYCETWIYSVNSPEQNSEPLKNKYSSLMKKDRQAAFNEELELLYESVEVWDNGIPAYDQNLHKAIETIEKNSDVVLFGNYLGKIGLGKIADRARQLAQRIINE